MDNTESISVIVPVYKVEKYLNRCIDSIIAQTYKNLEIILVDDGSPDNCGKICDEYAGKDSRIKVIHQKNGGLSAARNAGLDIATGEYVGFVDSDDYLEKNYFEALYNNIIENNADISVCGLKKFGIESKYESYGNKVLNKSEYLKMLLSDEMKSAPCNKLFKKQLFDENRFPVGEIFEDMKMMHLVAEKVRTVSLTEKTYYNYRIHHNSITNENKGIKAKEFYDSTCMRVERYKGTDYYLSALVGKFKCLRVIVTDMVYDGNKTELYNKYRKESMQVYKICKSEIKGYQKLLSILYLVSPKAYCVIKKFYLRG